jgi:N utilization substance protein A
LGRIFCNARLNNEVLRNYAGGKVMQIDFLGAIEQISKEKGIDSAVLLESIETAMASAYKKKYGSSLNVRVSVDRASGSVKVFAYKNATDVVDDANMEISLEDARKLNANYQIGDMVEIDVTPKNFGRIAAQNVRNVLVQKIREAERVIIYNKFLAKENEIVTGIVQRIEKKNIYIDLDKIEGILPPNERIPTEDYQLNERLKVYITEVKKTPKGPQIILSRTHPGLIRRLFEREVPEIARGEVIIKSVAREAGFRTKLAVYSHDSGIDPVGACVGQKGLRVQEIVDELKGEKIDIIKWSNDPNEFISSALSPAKVLGVRVYEKEKAARVIVADNQLSLAIGKEGQNARLAARLTGWKIDIKSQSQIEAMQNIPYLPGRGGIL